MVWACTACTYRNLNDAAKSCHVCATARVLSAANEQSTDNLTNGQGRSGASDTATIGNKKRKAEGQLTLFGDVVTATKANEKKLKSEAILGKGRKGSSNIQLTTSNAPSVNANTGESRVHSVKQSLASVKGVATFTYGPISNDPYAIRHTRSLEILKSVFKIEKLRNQQPKAIKNSLQGKSQVVVMVRAQNSSRRTLYFISPQRLTLLTFNF
jgi:hypothetical protein